MKRKKLPYLLQIISLAILLTSCTQNERASDSTASPKSADSSAIAFKPSNIKEQMMFSNDQ